MKRVFCVLVVSFLASVWSFSNNISLENVVGSNSQLDDCNSREQNATSVGCVGKLPAHNQTCGSYKRTVYTAAQAGTSLNIRTTSVPNHCEDIRKICTGATEVPVLDPNDPTKKVPCATVPQ